MFRPARRPSNDRRRNLAARQPVRRKGGEPRLGRMLLASLGLHLVVLLLVLAGPLFPGPGRDQRPVYYVDLVNLPVKNPQAGRPDAAPKTRKAEPRPAPAPKRQAKTVKTAKPRPKPEARPKAAPKPAPQPPGATYEKETLAAIEKLRREQEIAALKEKLAQMAKQDSRQAPADAPVGMPDGRGTEAGPSYDAWLHDYLKEAWTLSRYQVTRENLEATVTLIFDARGNLVDFRFLKRSGEERFDDSVKRAVLQLKQLPAAPGSRLEKDIVFNLKELLE